MRETNMPGISPIPPLLSAPVKVLIEASISLRKAALNQEICCAKFNPAPWNEKEIKWQQERFIKDHVTCFCYMPLNFGGKMRKNMKAMESAGAVPSESDFLVLSNNCSAWGMDLYIKTTKDVPNTEVATISGTFLSKVFEGPYKNISKWIAEMKQYAQVKGQEIKDLYFYYTTCPKCAKKYGKNYVVLLAKIDS